MNEESLARRIAFERERRHWSPGGLARLMTKAGCPMNQSAIWKIEHGQPRRKITVDEAIAFAKVFDTTLGDLLTPPELVTETALMDLISKYEEHYMVNEDTFASMDEIAVELQRLLVEHPPARDALRNALTKTFPNAPQIDKTTRMILDPEFSDDAGIRWWETFQYLHGKYEHWDDGREED